MTKLLKYMPARILPLLIGIILLSGCTVHYLPKPSAIDPAKIPPLTGQTITLENTQTDSTEITIGKASAKTMTGDLHSWTASAIHLLKTEFEKRDITVKKNAQKVLSLSIIKAELGVSGLQYAGLPKCGVDLEVKTDSGYKLNISIESNAMSVTGACDSAVKAAVSAMFMDDGLMKYIDE